MAHMRVLTDEEIAALISEQKPCPEDWRERLTPHAVAGARDHRGELELIGTEGNSFTVLTRLNQADRRDFSVILRFDDVDGQGYRLIRCNGPSHEHANWIEHSRHDFEAHIHLATERYQLAGRRIDAFAEVSEDYTDFWGAVTCLLGAGNCVTPPEAQLSIEDLQAGEDEGQ